MAVSKAVATSAGEIIAAKPRRTWEDHLAARLPRVYRALAWLNWRVYTALRPGHPLRLMIARRVASRSYGGFNRNDLDALLPIYHLECVWDWSHFEGWPDDPIVHGPEGLRRGWLVFREAWGEFHVEASELRDCGDRLIGTCRMRATGGGSGVGLETTWWQVGEVRDGLITLVANYTDRSEALEAAEPSG